MEPTKIRLLRVRELLYRTDEYHPMTAEQIVEKLRFWDIEAERKAVLRDVQALKDAGMAIELHDDNKKGFFLAKREFEDWELKVLIDAVEGANFLTAADSEKLVNQLRGMASDDAKKTLRLCTVPSNIKTGDIATKDQIAKLMQALRTHQKVRFHYIYTGGDQKKHLRYEDSMTPVSPYVLIWRQDKYYLIGHYESDKPLSYYRLDRIRDLTLTGEPAAPLQDLLGSQAEEKLKQFVKQNLYNTSGKQIALSLRAEEGMADTLIDYFGTDIHLMPANDGRIEVNLTVSASKGLFDWLMQYGHRLEVLKPPEVRRELAFRAAMILKKYGTGKETASDEADKK